MADVFISYSRSDAKKADAVDEYLQAQGWSVWRDVSIHAGAQWNTAIKRELNRAGCVVVLWSKASVRSGYVAAEARRGHDRGALVQAWFDTVELPIPFGEYQLVDLRRWRGGAESQSLDRLGAAVADVLEPATPTGFEDAARASLDQLGSPLVGGEAPGRRRLTALSTLFAREHPVFRGSDLKVQSGPASLFSTAIQAVAHKKPGAVLRIGGAAGTGADVMAACLYHYQLGRYRSAGGSEPYPIWLNLRDYDGLSRSELRLRWSLDRIDRLFDENPTVTPLLLMAGFDCFTTHRAALQEIATEATSQYRQIVAINRGVPNNGLTEEGAQLIPGGGDRAIRLCHLRSGTPESTRFVKSFAKLVGDDSAAASLERIVRVCRFSAIDVGTLSTAWAMQALDRGDLGHGGDYFHRYLEGQLKHHRSLPVGADPFARASEYAYEYTINGRCPAPAEQGSTEWQLVHQGEDLQRYLVANRIAQSAKNVEPSSADMELLRRPYADQTMRFALDIINASRHSEIKFVKRAASFFAMPDPEAVANMSFLLGRLEGAGARRQAEGLLRSTRDRFLEEVSRLEMRGAAEAEIGRFLFSLRTLFVSLIYLGDEKSSNEYIGYLLDDLRWNRINRSFHLEYYGDISILPVGARSLYKDPPATPFPLTYARLMEKIDAGLHGNRRTHFDLDVFTLYSLAQYRHLEGQLEPRTRRELVNLVPDLIENVKSDRLEAYVQMMASHLEKASFGTGAVAADLYRIKRVPREGWKKRAVRRPESVADHMYGAFLLAFCWLPLDGSSEGFDRDRILKLILVHDLAESETGDIVNKSDAEANEESRWFARSAALSSYTDLPGIGELGELWTEFEEQSTINARIAKDFDRLDQLVQLYIYRKQIHDFSSWRKELLGLIRTPQGRHVLEALTAHFDS